MVGRVHPMMGNWRFFRKFVFYFLSKIILSLNFLNGGTRMKNDFSKEQMKQLLIEIKNLMEVVSVKERHSNELLMENYVQVFIFSLIHFGRGEIWRD